MSIIIIMLTIVIMMVTWVVFKECVLLTITKGAQHWLL